MYSLFSRAQHTLQDRRAQLLLPAVLLLPLFVLVIYLLVETTKLSIAKVRHQFALDNAAYTQVTSVSAFLNAVGILNGPLPYRVMLTYNDPLKQVQNVVTEPYKSQNLTVFDLFFRAGAVPTVAPDYAWGKNPNPPADSQDWGVHYAKYDLLENNPAYKRYDRKGWEKETPDAIKDKVTIMDEEMVKQHYVSAREVALPAIKGYLNTYVQVGDIYNLQEDIYKKLIKNAITFRQGYYLNVDDCKLSSCARQSAGRLMNYLNIPTTPQKADDLIVYVSASDMAGGTGGAVKVDLKMTTMGADPLYLFAYVSPAGRSKLRTLKRGISLKQNFPLPRNHFNVNLESKYKPYVHNEVIMSCPRANNNCVWPNPLPKYNVTLRP